MTAQFRPDVNQLAGLVLEDPEFIGARIYFNHSSSSRRHDALMIHWSNEERPNPLATRDRIEPWELSLDLVGEVGLHSRLNSLGVIVSRKRVRDMIILLFRLGERLHRSEEHHERT